MKRLGFIITLGLILAGNAPAQQIVFSGYEVFPARAERVHFGVVAAPGQIISLFVSGLGDKRGEADHLPLPTTLAGVTVSLDGGLPMPLLAVRPRGQGLTEIIVQILFELRPEDVAGFFGHYQISVSGGPRVPLAVPNDNIRVLTSREPRPFDRPLLLSSCCPLPPYPLVTHADGSLVTESKPAKAGEMLVAYSFGLGLTNPPVRSGEASPSPPAQVANLLLGFEFRENAPPRHPIPPGPINLNLLQQLPRPVFAGLTPGYVGLYQINFRVPDEIPAGLLACGFGSVIPVWSNLTVSFARGQSFDGAAICVQP